jgi:AraC-like DNA-binding protein
MDPLSDVLSIIKTRHHISGALDATGAWCVNFPKFEGVRFYAVVRGGGWLAVEGVPNPIWVEEGDCFLFPNGQAFRAGSDLSLAPLDGFSIFENVLERGVVTLNGGGEMFGIAGLFTTDGDYGNLLLGLLPSIFLIRSAEDRAVLRWAIERLRHELMVPQPGTSLVAQQLSTLVLVQAIRIHLAHSSPHTIGWLSALADKRIGAAITAIHRSPGSPWTVETLGHEAGMSRTNFAVKFRETVGQSPMEYLTQWRMVLAKDRLTNTKESIAEIAPALGYESESAFSTAFKRVVGTSPREYTRRIHLISTGQQRETALAPPSA